MEENVGEIKENCGKLFNFHSHFPAFFLFSVPPISVCCCAACNCHSVERGRGGVGVLLITANVNGLKNFVQTSWEKVYSGVRTRSNCQNLTPFTSVATKAFDTCVHVFPKTHTLSLSLSAFNKDIQGEKNPYQKPTYFRLAGSKHWSIQRTKAMGYDMHMSHANTHPCRRIPFWAEVLVCVCASNVMTKMQLSHALQAKHKQLRMKSGKIVNREEKQFQTERNYSIDKCHILGNVL